MSEKVALVCQECGETWRVSPSAADPECPQCGGVDWEVREDLPRRRARGTGTGTDGNIDF